MTVIAVFFFLACFWRDDYVSVTEKEKPCKWKNARSLTPTAHTVNACNHFLFVMSFFSFILVWFRR